MPPGMVRLSFSRQLVSIWRHVREASVPHRAYTYLDKKRARNQNSISDDSSSSCGVRAAASAPLLDECENDPRFFTGEDMRGFRSLPDLPDPQQNISLKNFSAKEELTVFASETHVLSESSTPMEVWTHQGDREAGPIHTKQGGKLSCHPSTS